MSEYINVPVLCATRKVSATTTLTVDYSGKLDAGHRIQQKVPPMHERNPFGDFDRSSGTGFAPFRANTNETLRIHYSDLLWER